MSFYGYRIKPFVLTADSRTIAVFNDRLFNANNVEDTPHRRERICRLHVDRMLLYVEASKLCFSHPKQLFHEIRDKLTQIEYKLQTAWGFERLPEKHIHWRDLPGCRCKAIPKDVVFLERITSHDCPYHSDEI